MRLIHFSDVHIREIFAPRELPRVGWRRAAAIFELEVCGRARRFGDSLSTLRRLVDAMTALEPDRVLFSGDFTAMATEREFTWAREAVAPLIDSGRLSAVPGNHDRYTRGSVREGRFERFFGSLLQSDLPDAQGKGGFPFVHLIGESLAVIGLDTTRLAPLPGLAFGEIDRTQRELLARILDRDEVRRRAVAILLHHAPLNASGHADTPTHGLRGGSDLLRALKDRPRTSLHFGHIHQRYFLPANGSRPHLFNAGAGTMRPTPGFWVIDLNARGEIESAREVTLEDSAAPVTRRDSALS